MWSWKDKLEVHQQTFKKQKKCAKDCQHKYAQFVKWDGAPHQNMELINSSMYRV